MLKKLNFKSRRMFLVISFFVLLITLTSCKSAGHPSGNLPVDKVYAKAGADQVTVGELWNELKWNSYDVLTEKITEVVMKDYQNKVELIVDKNYSDLSDDDKKLFDEDFTQDKFDALKENYEARLENYVIEDVYNLEFSSGDSYEKLESIEELSAKQLVVKYADELYQQHDSTIDRNEIVQLCDEAAKNVEKKSNYLTIAKQFKNIYYLSLAKELLAYDKLEEDIKEAYDTRDTEDENDIGYFNKSDYNTKFKNKFANQTELNLILIRFSTEDEFNSTLRSFGIKQYNSDWYYIPSKDGDSFSDYSDYYDDLSSTDIKDLDGNLAAQRLSKYEIALIYIQMYNYLYGGYRDMINRVEDYSYSSVDLRDITNKIRATSQELISDEESLNNALKTIITTLESERTMDENDFFNVDTFYTREEIDDIDSNFSNYLYETLCGPFDVLENDDSKCYSVSSQSFDEAHWIAFKLGETEDPYGDIYNKKTIDDDLFESIEANEQLKADIEKLLKQDKITSSAIDTAVTERTDEVNVSIYDEALEINYATKNADYSKTYGKAPNPNVLATLKYDGKTWNVNIVEDANDENAVSGGVYNALEQENGISTSINILSKKLVKRTKAYEETKKDSEDYKEQIEYVLAAFSSDYYSSSGYPSTIGKYNFMMLYFHTANIDNIVDDIYRVNDAGAKLLTNYNSDALLDFFKTYTDLLYDNYFSISGKRLVVYQDANDDGEKDDAADWCNLEYTYTALDGTNVKTTRGGLAKEFIQKIYAELSATTGSHAEALSNLVTEIKASARALFEENPIAPENKWAVYRKAGLNVELEDVSATNDSKELDFALKERLYSIFNSDNYRLNETLPTEYIENLSNKNYDLLQTKDGFNLILITSAEYQTSAEFKAEDDDLEVFKNLSVYYNDEYQTIGNIYNEDKKLTKEQIRLYVLEYVSKSTSNLSPSAISTALTNYLSPVLTRYTGTQTQSEIIVYFIETTNNCKIEFVDQGDKYDTITEINHSTANDYIEIYAGVDPTGTLDTYTNWWTDLKNNVDKMLLKEGENK